MRKSLNGVVRELGCYSLNPDDGYLILNPTSTTRYPTMSISGGHVFLTGVLRLA